MRLRGKYMGIVKKPWAIDRGFLLKSTLLFSVPLCVFTASATDTNITTAETSPYSFSSVSGTNNFTITNAGSLSTGALNSVYFTNSTFDTVINDGSITTTGYGIYSVNSSSISSLSNSGTITADDDIYNDATIGTLTNTGTLSNTSYGIGNDNDGTITTLTNSGTISGGNYGIITIGNIGTINNSGTISGTTGIYNFSSGVITDLNNSGSITGTSYGINNSATIGSITNTGTITGGTYAIYNSGTITNGITNTSTINGNVYLGSASLNIVGSSAQVNGNISGSSSSAISIGDGSTTTAFSSSDDANVGTLTIFDNATLELTSGTVWSSDSTTVDSGGTVVLDDGSAIGDSTNTSSTITNNGTIYLGSSSGGTAETATIYGDLINNGTIDLATNSNTVGSTLTVNGDYTGGTSSSLYLGTVLGDDSSTTDKLVVTGDASGTSTVYFTNKGGSGAQTLNGIEVIEVDGTDTAAFTQGNRVVAGAYDYTLTENGSNWYLTSALTDTGDTSESITTSTVRPETSAYAGNMMASNTMFNINLNDYAGKTQYVDAQTGKLKPSNIWVRTEAGYTHFDDESGQISSHAKRALVQVGSDLAHWNPIGKQTLSVGVMGGVGDYQGSSRSNETSNEAHSESVGYSAGVYGRWFQNANLIDGAYADAWTQWNYFDNSVNGDDLSKEKYHSTGATASLQTGYNQAIGEAKHHVFWIQPKAQATWMNVRSDEHTESNGTYVKETGSGNVESKLGLKAFMTQSHNTAGDIASISPFVESNWIHNTKSFGAKMDGTEDDIAGTKNIGEFKVGVETKLHNNIHLVGDVAQQWGTDNYKDTSLRLQAKIDL
jgi:outer membrane autotransporter protein